MIGLAPGLAAVERNVDGLDRAVAGPGKAFDLDAAGTRHLHAARRTGDDRLALHVEAELTPLAFRHRVGVAGGLAARVPGLGRRP